MLFYIDKWDQNIIGLHSSGSHIESQKGYSFQNFAVVKRSKKSGEFLMACFALVIIIWSEPNSAIYKHVDGVNRFKRVHW